MLVSIFGSTEAKTKNMMGCRMNFYGLNSSWALFVLVANLATLLTRGQEAPLFNATTIESNQTFRTNFCERHKKVENGEIPLRHALKNAQLRPGIFRYQLNKETGTINEVDPPIGIKMLDEIARRAQFKWRDSYGVVDSPGENHTWGDVLSWSIDTYDFNGDWFLRTTDRLADGIIFPEKWYDGSLIMIRKRGEKDGSFQMFAFLDPFSYGVWMLILGTTLLSGIVYYAIDYIGCDGNKSKMENTLDGNIFDSFLNMTGQYLFNPSRAGNRIIAFSTCLLYLIILATYTANMASFFVIRNTPDVVINEIQDVIRNDLSLCVMRGTPADTFIRERYESVRIVEKESIKENYIALDNGDCDVALTTTGTWLSKKWDIDFNQDCRKEWVGRVVQPYESGFSLRDSAELCSSLVRDVFSLHLFEMKRDKTYQTIWEAERAESVTNNCQNVLASDDDESDAIQMSVKNLGGVFIVHTALLFIAFLYTILAKLKQNYNAKLAGTTFAEQSNLPSGKTSSAKSIVATANLASVSSFRPSPNNSVNDLEFSEEGVQNNGKQRDYTVFMKKQIDCMRSMERKMVAMQVQLDQLMELQNNDTPAPPNQNKTQYLRYS